MEQRVPHQRISVTQYLKDEAAASVRREYFDGEIVERACSTESHSLLIANLIGFAGNGLKSKRPGDCRIYDSNLKVRIAQIKGFYYPDAFIVCGPSEYPPEDENRTSVTNPRVIFEVLSDSTADVDQGNKFLHYALLPSLREYVLISQNEPGVQVFLRQDDGTWKLTFYRALDAVAKLTSIDIDLLLAEIYAGVVFADPTPPLSA